jgi:Mn-dependent DtxR family transcriptional regulator
MPLSITRDQRDAIYEILMDHLSGIEDVWTAVKQRDFATAKRLGRLFAEELRLLEDLGWSDRIERETVELTLPPDELARTLVRLHEGATELLDSYVSRPKDDEVAAQRDLVASKALGQLLSELAARSDCDEVVR